MTTPHQTNAVAKPVNQDVATIESMLQDNKVSIETVIPKHIDADRLMTCAVQALIKTPFLLKCEKNSFVNAVIQAAQCGLEPNTPLQYAAIVPYYVEGRYEAQFQPMYKGLLYLCKQSGEISDVWTTPVFTKDKFHYFAGSSPRIEHEPYIGADCGELTGVYMICWLKGATMPRIEWVPLAELQRIEREALANKKNPSASPWVKHKIEMYRKTALKRGLKTLPQYNALAAAIEMDNHLETIEVDYTNPIPSLGKASTVKTASQLIAEKAQEVTAKINQPVKQEPPVATETQPTDDTLFTEEYNPAIAEEQLRADIKLFGLTTVKSVQPLFVALTDRFSNNLKDTAKAKDVAEKALQRLSLMKSVKAFIDDNGYTEEEVVVEISKGIAKTIVEYVTVIEVDYDKWDRMTIWLAENKKESSNA